MTTDDTFVSEIEEKIGVKYNDKSFAIRAFTHRSYLNETSDPDVRSNERLEFLGDAVLQFLASEHIFQKYPDYAEGQLTNLRSRIVNTVSLSEESARLALGDYLRISRGERETALESSYILADTFEALLGSIYLDQGIESCRKFLIENLFYKVPKIIKAGKLKDSKSLFQELAQEKYNITPTYKVLDDEGPDHEKQFKVGVYLEKKLVADGAGSSKRKAQQEAAKKALEIESI